MADTILLKNAKICTQDDVYISDILIKNGIIAEIDSDCAISFDTKIIDVKESYVLPGLIDLNCEVCEPGLDYKEDLLTISEAASKSGFTSLTASPNTEPVVDNKIVVKHLMMLADERATVNIYPYGHMTKGGLLEELSEMGEMYRTGIVAISDGNRSVIDAFLMSNIFNYAKMFDIPVITFCQNPYLNNNGLINFGYISMLTGLSGSPKSAEEVYVSRNIILAKEQNCKVHITKVSTKGSVELIRQAKKDGVKVTCDTCPHYIFFSEDRLLNYDTYYKVSPPLRTEEDNLAIIEGLKDGTIDAISTGHFPEHEKSKKMEFEAASFGFSGLEPAFTVLYNGLVLKNHLSLYDLLQKLSKNAYNILKIKNKGEIKIGYDADLFVFDETSTTFVDEKELSTKAKYSIYNNQTFTGEVTLTLVGGKIVYEK